MKKILMILFSSIFISTLFIFGCSVSTAINITESSISLYEGESFKLSINVDSAKWYSEDEGIVNIKDGFVTAVGKGVTYVYAEYNSSKDSCKVTVLQKTNINDDTTHFDTFSFSNTSGEKSYQEIFKTATKSSNSFYYNGEFVNKLDMPSSSLKSVNDIPAILDYMAFYHINKFDVSIEYSSKDFKLELQDKFWDTYICPGVVGVSCLNNNDKTTIIMYFNEDANSYTFDKQSGYGNVVIPYTFYSQVGKRDLDFDDFNYKEKNSGLIDVYNSDQLLYVLENGYLPNIIQSSPAEELYNYCKFVLNSIIYDDMENYDKIIAIESFLYSNVIYDFEGDDIANYTSKELFDYPDFIPSSITSFYAEGALLHQHGVCHGYAKAFNILACMEGIEAIKVSTTDKQFLNNGYRSLSCIEYLYDGFNNVTGSQYSSHGYSYVLDENDNKYYICDVVYALGFNVNIAGLNYSLPRMLAIYKGYDDWKEIYNFVLNDWFYLNSKERIGLNSYNWLERFEMRALDKSMDLYISSVKELETIRDHLDSYIDSYSNSIYNLENKVYTVTIYFDDSILNDIQYFDSILNAKYSLGYYSSIYGYSDLGFIIIFEEN